MPTPPATHSQMQAPQAPQAPPQCQQDCASCHQKGYKHHSHAQLTHLLHQSERRVDELLAEVEELRRTRLGDKDTIIELLMRSH